GSVVGAGGSPITASSAEGSSSAQSSSSAESSSSAVGAGGAGSACAHDVCVSGAALVDGCSPCAQMVCAKDSYCCTTKWNLICVSEAKSACGLCASASSSSASSG